MSTLQKRLPMRSAKKIAAKLLLVCLAIPVVVLLLLFGVLIYSYCTVDLMQPDVQVDLKDYELLLDTDSLRRTRYGSLYRNRHGLWEMRIAGSPIQRGAALGVMARELLKYQEDVFVNEIHKIVPSERRVRFLHKFIIVFNRKMARHIPLEYREEIYANSLSCTDVYNAYGPPYGRQLNYHAAHDIGHAMQEYMLVGCSSFAVWGDESETGELLVGRNFDFYVGDDFAKHKIILFVEPDEGERFVSVSWPGMLGILSGMNESGLTVTINAAKGPLPLSSAMPISLLTRRILQYATTIDEAYAIAQEHETFVSESILVSSAKDGRAAVIEKTPKQIALYTPPASRLVCTNHYQSDSFANNPYNLENIATSDSPYRHRRLNQLLNERMPIDARDAAAILRNRFGENGADIGLSNEKSINQFIAHHSVVFQPAELKMWVSTAPWQLGEYVCYDLRTIFATNADSVHSYASDALNIPSDSVALGTDYVRVRRYREQVKTIKSAIAEKERLPEGFVDDFLLNNPNNFQTHNLLGDYMLRLGDRRQALEYWRRAVELEIPRVGEKEAIRDKIEKYD